MKVDNNIDIVDRTKFRFSDVRPEVFDIILHYVYTGKVRSPKRILETVDLMHAAKLYDINRLYEIIRQLLTRRLAKFRTKHLIMITQRVLDLGLTDLKDDCFKLIQQNTDDIVMDPFFLRVSTSFICEVLKLDSFEGIGEGMVFTRILGWARLRIPEDHKVSRLETFR